MKTLRLALLVVVVLACVSRSAFPQGTLTPPGSPAPTMKSLDQIDGHLTEVDGHLTQVDGHITPIDTHLTQVDSHVTKAGEKRIPIDTAHTPGSGSNVFVIKNPGSYYLAGNIVLTDKAQTAILITAPNVTVDLNGFGLSNNATATDVGGGAGVLMGARGCIVKNGAISGFSAGVRGQVTGTSETSLAAMVVDLVVRGCANGIVLNNAGSLVRNCVASDCTFGIAVGLGSKVENCTANNNAITGINAAAAANIIGCTARNNGAQGSSTSGGIVVDFGATVTGCTVANNTTFGIQTTSASLVSNCTATNNIVGIEVSLRSTVIDCTASSNAKSNFGSGIQSAPNQAALADVSVVHCTASGNTYGITVGQGCTVSDCTVGHSIFEGIRVDFGSTVRHCTTRFNGDSGIFVTGGCYVADNVADSNNQRNDSPFDIRVAGIYAYSNSNRIEGNSMTFNSNCPGLTVEGVHNLILHNSARGHVHNYNLATNNRYGPIVDLTSDPNFGPVNGNFAGSTLDDAHGGSHPWANYAY